MLWTLSRRRFLYVSADGLSAACALPPPSDNGGEGEGEGEGEARVVDWAVTGTAAMVGKANYRDPFSNVAAAVCPLTCELTLGPCFAASPQREDISEGATGVPVRLLLRIVDADTCAPIAGAVVDVWHCGPDGLYTGDDTNAACRQGDDEAAQRRTFRGTQESDDDGRVAFDTCYPGWYPGRAVHMHIQVSSEAGTVASQIFFDEPLTADITSRVQGYVERGAPDTDHGNDLLAAAADPARFILNSEATVDGAVLAWTTIAVRAAGGRC